jgi:hypothetical protein
MKKYLLGALIGALITAGTYEWMRPPEDEEQSPARIVPEFRSDVCDPLLLHQPYEYREYQNL